MTYRRTLAGVAALGAAFLMSAAHSQHALDKLLESEPANKPRQTSNIDSSVTESANRGHEALQDKVRRVEQVKRNLSDGAPSTGAKEGPAKPQGGAPLTGAKEAAAKLQGGAPSTGAKETPAKPQRAGTGMASFECRVFCKDPDGQVSVTMRADSKGDAAQIVDRQGHDICKRAGHGRATSSTMSASQCSQK